jgi:hypothetical protein
MFIPGPQMQTILAESYAADRRGAARRRLTPRGARLAFAWRRTADTSPWRAGSRRASAACTSC